MARTLGIYIKPTVRGAELPPVDLSKVEAGIEPDVPVQPEDVVFVQRSLLGTITYGAYAIFTHSSMGIYAEPV
jgi:hypothetical protein